jgi:hypothetical protein
MFQRLDAIVLNKIFTPFAHYVQRRTGVISYEWSRACCQIAAVVIVTFVLYRIVNAYIPLTPLTVFMTVTSLVVAAVYWSMSVYLQRHLRSTDAWKTEPLLSVYITQQIWWYCLLVFTFALLAVAGIPLMVYQHLSGSAHDVVTNSTKDGVEVLRRTVLYDMLYVMTDTSEVFALYFMRVRPLPPAPPEITNELAPMGA